MTKRLSDGIVLSVTEVNTRTIQDLYATTRNILGNLGSFSGNNHII